MPKDKAKPAAADQAAAIIPSAAVTQIGASPYYILPDGSVARRLKPTLINGTPYYNLCIGKAGKTMRTRHDKLQEFAQAYAELTAAKAAQPNA